MTVDRYESMRTLYGETSVEKIAKSKVLVVGAGGIGCEVIAEMNQFILIIIIISSNLILFLLMGKLDIEKSSHDRIPQRGPG